MRSLDSFGVAGVLGENAEVFYSVLFSTRHAGRVTDLLASRLKKGGIDELKFRTLLLYSIFQAYRGQVTKRLGFRIFSNADADSLDFPLVMECGIDSEKIAVSLCFSLNNKTQLIPEGLADRIQKKEFRDTFEEWLLGLHAHVDQLVLKYQPVTKKVEIISLMGIVGKIDPVFLQSKPPIEIVVFENEPRVAPKPKLYVDLGDLNYSKLLKRDTREKVSDSSATGQLLMPEDSVDSVREVPIVQTIEAPQGLNTLFRKFRNRNAPTTAASQASVKTATGVQEVEAGTEPSTNQDAEPKRSNEKKRVETDDFRDNLERQGNSEPQDHSLVEDSSLDADLDSQAPLDSYETLEDGATSQAQELRGSFWQTLQSRMLAWLKSLFGTRGDTTQSQTATEAGASELASPDGESENLLAGSSTGNPDQYLNGEAAQADASSVEIYARQLVVELRTGKIDQVLRQARREMASMTQGLNNPKMVEWLQSVIEGFAFGRASLHERARKLSLSIRKKDIEAKEKLTEFQNELKRREIQLNTKNAALMRTKEQILQMNNTIESLKQAAQETGDDALFKQKYTMAQRAAAAAKEDTIKLQSRIDELRIQLSSAQASNKSRPVAPADFVALQARYDRVCKQAEEFRKANRQLMEHLDNLKRDRSSPHLANEQVEIETTRRLDAAMKLATANKREAEAMKEKALGLQKQEAQSRVEINSLKAVVKRLRIQLEEAERKIIASGQGSSNSSNQGESKT